MATSSIPRFNSPDFYDENALIERLSYGLKKRPKEVIFLVGSPLSAPQTFDAVGVPGVSGVIDLIRREFEDNPADLAALNEVLALSNGNEYPAAFSFLHGRRGQETANEIIRAAVFQARLPNVRTSDSQFSESSPDDEACRALEFDVGGWQLSPGVEAVGKLLTEYPHRFGRCLLTTNFDPLIEVAIRRANGAYFRTTLHADGNLSQTEGVGCHVVHLHGYWFGSDTLHTIRQLTQPRPRLRASLSRLLRNKTVVVCGYGGWDDAFTEALISVVLDDAANPDIIWTFLHKEPNVPEPLFARLSPGLDRGRVSLYSGIDCHSIFPKLYERWQHIESAAEVSVRHFTAVQVSEIVRAEVEHQLVRQAENATVIEGDDEDRPPLVEICVGRDGELKELLNSAARVIFITGIGGEGKSTLTAKYFERCQNLGGEFSFFVWRDCKEEGERFENQLASVIESLSHGKISGKDLAEQSVESIVEIIANLLSSVSALFVFDNADHYVDLEAKKMTGGANLFIEALLKSRVHSRVVFTCRPHVKYDHPLVLSLPVAGIDLNATLELFNKRGASSDVDEIKEAHALTDGHAFWLDLLAIQVTKRGPGVDLTRLLSEIRSDGGTLPLKTLNSIWATLKPREQIVLRAMAETVKPETERQIGHYLRDELNYNKFSRALAALRAFNLIVVKPRPGATDLLELHPLVRHFVRSSFAPTERRSYIDAIIRVYRQSISNYKLQLGKRPALSILQHWTQNAELDIAAGKFDDAFSTLAEVADAFSASAYPREFCRAARILFESINWVDEYKHFKTFEKVFRHYVENLSHLGEDYEVDKLLHLYEQTVPNKDSRYIHYCGMRCRVNWIRRDFLTAISWGKLGKNLKTSTDVDGDEYVVHSLALAERDSGQPESALPVFLAGQSLAEATNPNEPYENRPGQHYGNIGRCLHMMGQVEPALVCYQKSAILIEKDETTTQRVLNQGYIRSWIGELLAATGDFKLAQVFLRAAYLKWKEVSPRKADLVMSLSGHIRSRYNEPVPRIENRKIEDTCLDWILSRHNEPRLRRRPA